MVEAHAGGGQHDCITLYHSGRSWTGQYIALNRAGSAHVHDGEHHASLRDVWTQAARGGVDAVADDIALLAQLRPRATQPAASIWRQSAAAIANAVIAGRTTVWRNGVLDTSGHGGGVRRELFDAFPEIGPPPAFDDGAGPTNRIYDHWFLIDNDVPVRHIDVTAPT